MELDRNGRAALDRIAVPKVLCAQAYLTIRRRKQPGRALCVALTRQPGAAGASPAPVTNVPETARQAEPPSATSPEVSQTTRPARVRRIPRPAVAGRTFARMREKNSHGQPASGRIRVGPSSSGATVAADSPAGRQHHPGVSKV